MRKSQALELATVPGAAAHTSRREERGQAMRCFFDVHIGREVDVDSEGVEVHDLDSAISQACSAVEELRKEIDLSARLGTGAIVVVRVRTECVVCEISLDA